MFKIDTVLQAFGSEEEIKEGVHIVGWNKEFYITLGEKGILISKLTSNKNKYENIFTELKSNSTLKIS